MTAAITSRLRALAADADVQIGRAGSTRELEDVRVAFLGRKAELPQILRGLAGLPEAQRRHVGSLANGARREMESLIAKRDRALEAAERDQRLTAEALDMTLPGAPPQPIGALHLITQTQREIEDIFVGLGFSVLEGREVELTQLNFDALNHPATHPTRGRSDTFYVNDDVLLRTHTSPMQIRAMRIYPPPLFVVIPGRVYRRDSDATHNPQFHQVEGLAIGQDVSLADLKGTLLEFARQMFADRVNVRLRGHYFPFTEPSVEIDVECFRCLTTRAPDCPVCKGERWLEILGAGQIDPAVLTAVGEDAYDPDDVQGFAFGMGVERVAMLKHGVEDLRMFLENDLRFVEQFR